MPAFEYLALNPAGKEEKGILEATATVSQLPQRQTTVSLNGRGVPLNVLQQWGWPALPIAGDGNIHVHVMDDPRDKQRWARVEEASARIVMKALAFEGTCTGEHGVGIGKRSFMPAEHGESLALMKRIKAWLDPDNLFNPGKIFP